MINRLGVENRNINSKYTTSQRKESVQKEQDTSFKGGGVWGTLLWGIQKCEENPMVNVAVIDMFSAILPRTIVESKTNWFAGFEAFRREASGLVVNCLIPGAIAWLGAVGLNKFIMPKGSSMASCWADHSLIDRTAEFYKKSNSDDKIKESFKEILSNLVGVDGKDPVLFKEALKDDIEKYSEQLKELVNSKDKKINFAKETKKIAKEMAKKTHSYENLKINGEKVVKVKSLNGLLEDSVRFFREYQKVSDKVTIEEFAKKSKKLVKGKSALGLAIILPLAASMQYINRWITEKTSGVKGAPIYEDFGKEHNEEVRKKSQEGLLKQKIISISSMIGVSLLSMMKRPAWNMLEFKGWFPTMDQARVISTTTFASRMAVADDKNELAEATIRDIATFSGLYFLGDYAGKATATILEKRFNEKLLNDFKPLKGNENSLQKLWHWIKDVNIKSSEEVLSKKAINLRSACQFANLGVSLLLLGLIVPTWTRNNTKKKHAEMLKQMQETGINNSNSDKKETELAHVS